MLAAFAEPDDFVLDRIRKVIGDGIVINGTKHPVEILERDAQSNDNRSAQVASEFIKSENIDILLPANTPTIVNPASDQAEINGVPCISTDAPYEAYYYGRGGTKEKGFKWTYDFFWGEDDLIQVYADMWLSLPTNKIVGALWSNSVDGNAEKEGFSPVMKEKGLKIIDNGRSSLTLATSTRRSVPSRRPRQKSCNGLCLRLSLQPSGPSAHSRTTSRRS